MRGLTGEWTKFRTVVLTVRGDTKSLFLGAFGFLYLGLT